MNKVILSGYYGFGNSGDEAILKTIISDLKELQPNIEVLVLSKDPEKTERQYSVKSIDRYNVFQIIKHIKACDLLISGGGSLLQDNTSARSLFYYLSVIRIALFFNKRVMIYANGIGPIKRPLSKRRVKDVLERVDIITLREEDSYNTLKEIGVSNSNMLITADPVLNHSYADRAEVDRILGSENIPTGVEFVGLNVRAWRNIDNVEDAISIAADYIHDEYSLVPLFINMSAEDRNVAERVRRKMKRASYILQKEYTPEQLIGIIGRTKLVIAMRLHTLIYASIFGLPVIGLEYDPKVRGYLNYIKQTSICNVEKITAEELKLEIDKIMCNYESEKDKLKAMIDSMKLQSKRNADIAIELLEADRG